MSGMVDEQAWTCYMSAMLSMRHHPGQNKENAVRLTIDECAKEADLALVEHRKRFTEGDE